MLLNEKAEWASCRTKNPNEHWYRVERESQMTISVKNHEKPGGYQKERYKAKRAPRKL